MYFGPLGSEFGLSKTAPDGPRNWSSLGLKAASLRALMFGV